MPQADADVGVVVRPVERLLEPPTQLLAWPGVSLHRLEVFQRLVDPGVRRDRAGPVLLQRKQPVREPVAELRADEVTAVLPENLLHVRLLVPAEGGPDHLVDVVVATLR